VRLWQGLDDVPADWRAAVVTIGVFDGVHRGHQRLVRRAAEAAEAAGLPVVAVTFDPHPDEVVRPGTHPPFLCTSRRRGELLAGLGVDAVCVLPFTYEFSQLRPDEFVRAVLVDKLRATRVVIGATFRFGNKAAGDLGLLTELGEKYDFVAEGVPLLVDGGVTISSSHIRERLAAGDVEGAARALGFPTANLEWPPHTAIPADGVYAGWLSGFDPDGRPDGRWPAAISVGTNPTFEEGYRRDRTVEAYALDRDDLDLYGTHVAVDFAARLRSTEKFGSVAELVAQMHKDADQARRVTLGGGSAAGAP